MSVKSLVDGLLPISAVILPIHKDKKHISLHKKTFSTGVSSGFPQAGESYPQVATKVEQVYGFCGKRLGWDGWVAM